MFKIKKTSLAVEHVNFLNNSEKYRLALEKIAAEVLSIIADWSIESDNTYLNFGTTREKSQFVLTLNCEGSKLPVYAPDLLTAFTLMKNKIDEMIYESESNIDDVIEPF